MIAIAEDVILIKLPEGEIRPMGVSELSEKIFIYNSDGVQIEGWAAYQIAQAVVYFIREELQQQELTVEQLKDIFYLVINRVIVPSTSTREQNLNLPVIDKDLYELAVKSGYGFELVFFNRLEKWLKGLEVHQKTMIRLCGLRRCVKALSGAKIWGKGCQKLSDDIIAFLRQRLNDIHPQAETIVIVS